MFGVLLLLLFVCVFVWNIYLYLSTLFLSILFFLVYLSLVSSSDIATFISKLRCCAFSSSPSYSSHGRWGETNYVYLMAPFLSLICLHFVWVSVTVFWDFKSSSCISYGSSFPSPFICVSYQVSFAVFFWCSVVLWLFPSLFISVSFSVSCFLFFIDLCLVNYHAP